MLKCKHENGERYRKRLEFEFDLLDGVLWEIIFFLVGFSSYHFGKDVIATHLVRTHGEQVKICSDRGLPYYHSVHQCKTEDGGYRGADLRRWIYTEEEINLMREAVHQIWRYSDKHDIFVTDYRDIRGNLHPKNHIHLQIPSIITTDFYRRLDYV